MVSHDRTPLRGLRYITGVLLMVNVLDIVVDHDPLDYENKKGANIKKIKSNEGGWVNDPNDRGGETNFGVSTKLLNSLHSQGRWLGYKTVNDIPNDSAATAIFEKEFFRNNEINYGTNDITLKMNDISVNVGGGNGTLIMQRAINTLHPQPVIKEDGGMGDNTRKAYGDALAFFGQDALMKSLINQQKKC